MPSRNITPFLLALGLFTLGALMFGSPKIFAAGADTFNGTLDVATFGTHAHIDAPNTRVWIGGTKSDSQYKITITDACTNATSGNPGMNVTYDGVTKSSNSAANCVGNDIVFSNVQANHTLVASKINGEGHQPFKVTVTHPTDNSVYVSQLGNPNRKVSGWGSNDEDSSFTVWAGEGYKVQFESDCSSDTVFFKWQDADDGNGDNSYRNASLDVKYIGPGGSPVKIITKKNLGGQGQSRYVSIDLDPDYVSYEIIWHGISNGNAIKMAAPFARSPGKTCGGGGPTSTPGSTNPTCTSLNVNNGNGQGAGTYYHTPGGADYKTNTVVNVDNVTPGISGTYSNNGGGSGAIVGFGASSHWDYIPTQPSINVKTYLIYHNTSTGKWGKVPGSDTSQPINCYSAQCNTYQVIGNAPNGKVKHGSTFSVRALVWNDGAAPLRDYLEGHTLQLQNNGGDIGFAQQVAGMDAGGGNYYHYITFTAVAPPSGTSATIVAQMAYGGDFFMGSPCSINVNLYQGPQINISATGGCFQISGIAYSPDLPGTPITIIAYADGSPVTTTTQTNPANNAFFMNVDASFRDGNDHTFHLYAIDPYGSENGGPANVTMTGCSAFHIDPKTYNGILAPDSEDPTSFSASTKVTVTYENGWGGPASGVPATVTTWYQKDGADVTAPVAYPFTQFINRSGHVPAAYPINGGYVAGTKYCLLINAYYTDGFVDRNGYVFPGSSGSITNGEGCDQVVNKPFFKVLGGNISAGGEFSSPANPTCSTPAGEGILAGYYNNTFSGYSFGSSAELTAQAMRQITGVASAQTNPDRSPTDLTFANDGAVTTNDDYDPLLGGNFDTSGGNNCLTAADADTDKPISGFASGNPISAGMDGQYTSAGPTTISGGQVGVGKNVSIFADGDVAITNDITYAGATGGGWSVVNGTKGTDMPSLVIHAKGNIYIDSSVGTLDGIYIAQKSGSRIYTCSSGYSPVASTANYFNTCQRQLTVHGSFVADHVNLMRTYGTMRDEKPGLSGGGGGTPASGRSVPLYMYKCAIGVDFFGRPYPTGTLGHHQFSTSPTAPSYCNLESNGLVGYIASKPATDGSSLPLYTAGANGFSGDAVYGTDYSAVSRDSNNASFPTLVGYVPKTKSGTNSGAHKLFYYTDNENDHYYGTSQPSGGDVQNKGFAFYLYNAADMGGDPGSGPPPIVPVGPSRLDCDNNGSGNVGLGANNTFLRSPAGMTARSTCAAEVFDFSSELYLGKPSVKKEVKHPDALTSLPPVL